MIPSVDIDLALYEASRAEAEKVIKQFETNDSRKTLIEAGNEGIINALRRHFSQREKEAPKSTGFPWFGQRYPKRYFWRGTRGNSVAEKIRITLSSPARLEGQVSIDSPALKHKLSTNPPPIKPKGGKRYLALPANPIAAQWDGMPRDFPGGLRFAFSKTPDGHWLPSLIAAQNYKHKAKKSGRETKKFDGTGNAGENEVVFWLVHKVKTRRDLAAMPHQRVMVKASEDAIRTAVRRILAQRPLSTP